MYISIILKFIKILKMLKIKNKNFYLALPMLLLEGGQGLGHLESPCRHMETALVPVAIAPTRYRNHHCIHYALCLLLHDGGRCLPICLASADVEIGLVEVWRGSTLVLSLEEGNQYARIPKVLSPSSLAVRELLSQNRDNSRTLII